MNRLRTVAVVVVLAANAVACSGGDDRVVVAAGTTLVDSGVVDSLADDYEASHPGIEISVVGLATREVLELGKRGAADLLITHAPNQEREFIASHPDAAAQSLFSSRFLLVGPEDRVDAYRGLSITAALQRMAADDEVFVTRADGSGTYEREQALWAAAGIDPGGEPWYAETGLGMGPSLLVADQLEAFILVEEGTFLAATFVRLRRVEVAGGESLLVNSYTAILPADHDAAAEFLEWLISQEGRSALQDANYEIFGSAVLLP